MRRIPPQLTVFAAFFVLWGAAVQAGEEGDLYRADILRPLPVGAPLRVRAVLPEGRTWPSDLRREIEERVRHEWPTQRLYGPLQSSFPVWLRHPLLTTSLGGQVLVPVLEGRSLQVAGRLELPAPTTGPKRVVLLLDASSSANARTRFQNADGSTELVTVLEAERRALEHLLSLIADDWLEFGVIAFGESTWPIAEPGLSAATVRERLEEFRSAHPRGEGRTDVVCALWTAEDWLRDTPDGVEKQVVLLTDGDLPHSGRFSDCKKRRSREARARCEEQVNRTPCPARRRLPQRGGRSDMIQLEELARKTKGRLPISPVVFESDRSARAYRKLATATGGSFVQVPSAQGIEVALPPLIAGRVGGVYATNRTTGVQTGDLRREGGDEFAGALPLAPGGNDVELRVASDRGTAALFRFRVYAAPSALADHLAQLRERTLQLEQAAGTLVDEARTLQSGRKRSVEVATD